MTQLNPILQPPEGVEIFAMTANDMCSELKSNPDAQVLWSREVKDNPATAKIPKEYQEYQILF